MVYRKEMIIYNSNLSTKKLNKIEQNEGKNNQLYIISNYISL